MNAYPKKFEGLCIGVLSGDRILFQGPPDRENGGFKQKILVLSGIQAPKYDMANGKEEKYGYMAREFMRKKLVGKKLPFVVEKKINDMEVGYVLCDGEDATISLLREGLAKLRGDKTGVENLDSYKDAEEDGQVTAAGIWSEQTDKRAFRQLNKNVTDADLVKSYKGQIIKAVVEEVHPSKAVLYFPKQNTTATLNYSQVQTVVLTEKLPNGESKNNARAIRSVLESSFLHREVSVVVSALSKDSLTGYLVSAEGIDVRKVLLENGFAKLSKEAMEGVTTKEFMELKKVAQVALEEGRGLWKEQKVTKSSTSNNKEFTGQVVEVHSGDSLTIFNEGKKQLVRVFFPHTRAPAVNQSYSYQSKQALRKRCIGKKVRVEVEFMKKIPVKKLDGTGEELKDFTYASVFQNNANLSVFMLEQGLVTVQQIRTQEEVSKYLQQLKQAEAKGKKQRRGLHQSQHIKVPTFNDVSGGKGKKIDASKAKNLFTYLQDEPHLTGVIEVVLNGSRFKLRFNQQHIMAIVVLDGVRCLSNEGEFSKISQEALNYSKRNALQRDCEVKIKRVDLKGVYHAQVTIGKRDWASELLENGLAVTVERNKNQQYEEIEAKARAGKVGLWKYDFNLTSIKGETEKDFKPVNFTKTLILAQVNSAEEFYMESEGSKKPDLPQKPTPSAKIKVGDLYSAQFTDGVFYRAKVLKETKAGFEVFFIDYGNYDVVPRAKIGDLEQNMKKLKPLLFRCSLYGLEGFTKQAYNILCENINKKLKVEIKEQAEDGESRVILWDKDNCLNLELIQLGEAENTTTNAAWEKAEETARRNREGKWNDE